MNKQLQKLTLFYDGACPLCQAEILILSGRNEAGHLDFVDIHSERYGLQAIGVSCEMALATMYGQFEDGKTIHGVSVFSEAYKRARLTILAWIFSRKALLPALQFGYAFFAKYRHWISGLLGPGVLWLVRGKSKKASA